ncbi:MAG: hypothetical protein PGN33_01655 [Methylobacterium radiotolerans]
MAVVLGHDVQMPPPGAASPGLPPVDPVVPANRPGRSSQTGMVPESADADRDTSPNDATGGAGGPVADRSAGPVEPKRAFELRLVDAPSASPDAISRDLRTTPNPLATPEPDAAFETSRALKARNFPGFRDASESVEKNAFSPVLPTACGHRSDGAAKDRWLESYDGHLEGLDALLDEAMDHLSLAFDTRPGIAADHGDKPTAPRRRVPPRIEKRPKPGDWDDDALLSLIEAAALFWPDGPITVNTLRTAARDRSLEITKIAGKFFTTPSALRRMGLNGPGEATRTPVLEPVAASAETMFEMKLAEAKRLGVGHARRSRRAAKRLVAPTGNGRAGQ